VKIKLKIDLKLIVFVFLAWLHLTMLIIVTKLIEPHQPGLKRKSFEILNFIKAVEFTFIQFLN